jgi:hypothetical protein
MLNDEALLTLVNLERSFSEMELGSGAKVIA